MPALHVERRTDPSAKPILLMAHMDVVPVEPGTESSWTHGPFSGDVAKDLSGAAEPSTIRSA